MKKLLLLPILLLVGCSAVPVQPKFPEVPERLMQRCPDLAQLPPDAKLSDVAKVVTSNYTTYHECSVKLDGFIEWYQAQKQIYNKALK